MHNFVYIYIYKYIFFSFSFSFPLRKNIVLTINNIDTRPPQLHLQQLLTETNEQQREEDEPSEFPGKSIYSYYYTKETCFDTKGGGGGCDYDIQLSIKTKTLPPCSLNLANSQLNKYMRRISFLDLNKLLLLRKFLYFSHVFFKI